MGSKKGRILGGLSFLFIIISLMSCGGRGGDVGEKYTKKWCYERIEGWQTRELDCLDYPEYNYSQPGFIIELSVLNEINMKVSSDFKYVKDEGNDYWQTTCETIHSGKGDCEDLAILLWWELRKTGYPDKKNGLILSEKSGLFHVFVAVYYSEDDFYIIDPTGYYSSGIVKGSEFFAAEGINPILWFNLFLIREFKKDEPIRPFDFSLNYRLETGLRWLLRVLYCSFA